jgi:NTP pyrophosphatase (non-canonical NTP hydrolase)
MTLDEYQEAAEQFAIYPPEHRIVYPALGLAGEAGEAVEHVKKSLRDGVLNRDSLIRELGDVLWYVAALARDIDCSLSEIAAGNIDKLTSRASRGVIGGSGDNR